MSTPTARYRAAIIGCGAVAGGYDRDPSGAWTATHAGAYRLSRSVQLVAIADSSSDALHAFDRKWGVGRAYDDFRRMLSRERPDIVSVCVPSDLHRQVVEAACEYGARALFLEKPVAGTLVDARAITTVIGDRPVAVNYFRRWNPTLVALRRALREGAFGLVRRVTVHYVKGLLGNGSHFVDLLRWLFGEPIQVRELRTFTEPRGDPGVDLELVFEGGVVACLLHLPLTSYVLHDVDILTDRARLVIGQRGQKFLRFALADEPHYGRFRILRLEGGSNETAWRNCLLRAVEELAQALHGGRLPSCTLHDGVRALEICNQARQLVPAKT